MMDIQYPIYPKFMCLVSEIYDNFRDAVAYMHESMIARVLQRVGLSPHLAL